MKTKEEYKKSQGLAQTAGSAVCMSSAIPVLACFEAFMVLRDLLFIEKVRDIVGLY